MPRPDTRQGEEVTRLIRFGYRMVGASLSVIDDTEITLDHDRHGRVTVYHDGSMGNTTSSNPFYDAARVPEAQPCGCRVPHRFPVR